MGELVDALLMFGLFQGAVLALVLARRRENALANRLLAALTAAVSLLLLSGYCQQRWAFTGHPHLLALGAPLPFVFGPLLYLYCLALTRPVVRFDPRWLVHAAPFLIDLIFMTQQFYLKSGADKLAIARAYDAGHSSRAANVIDALELLQAGLYLWATWRELARYGRKMSAYYSDLTRIDLRWLRVMVVCHAATWTSVLVACVLRQMGSALAHEVDASGVQVGSTVVLFLTGYMSLWQPELAQKAGAAAELIAPEPEPERESPPLAAAPLPPSAAEPARLIPAPVTRPRYQRNRLDDGEAEDLVHRLLVHMQSAAPYRDGALTLPALADGLGVSAHTLSQLLNVHVGKSFYVFVNGYRVEALKLALADPTQNARGVLEIAHDVGFNSKSTLNAFFKRETGLTPTEYRSQARGAETSAV